MIAIFKTKWIKYECNVGNRPDIIAISNQNRTKYDCNLFQKGPNMIAMSKIILGLDDFDFCMNLVKIDFRLLQSNLVLFEKDCNHIWPPS